MPRLVFLLFFLIGLSKIYGKILQTHRNDALYSLSTLDLVNRSKDYIFNKELPDSGILCLEIVEHRASLPNLTSEEANIISHALNMLGGMYVYHDHNYTDATIKLLRAKQLADKYDCHESLSEILGNLAAMNYEEGILNNRTNFIDESIEGYIESLKLANKVNNYEIAGYDGINLATVAFKYNIPEKALPWLDLCIANPNIFQWQKDICAAVKEWYNGDHLKALEMIDQSVEHTPINSEEVGEAIRLETQKLKSDMLYRIGKVSEAIMLKKELLETAKNLKMPVIEYMLWKDLSEYALANGDIDESSRYELNMYKVKERMQSSGFRNAIAEGRAAFDNENTRIELTEASARIRSYRTIAIIILGFSLLLLVLLIIIFRKYRQIGRDREMLVKKDIELIASTPKKPISEPTSSKIEDKQNELFLRIKEVMESNAEVFSEDFSIVRLCQLLNEKQANVSSAIQAATSQNFSTFLATIRIKEACRRIIDKETYGSYTIESIATDVGYKSRSHFSSVFKKVTGLSPSQYQKEAVKLT